MATVTAPYTMADGTTLDADQYNDNLYDPSVAGRGIWSEPNGRLDASNLASGFAVQAEHVMPGELIVHSMAYETEPADFYDDGSAVDNEPTPAAPAEFIPVAGAACRVHIPHRMVVLWEWQAFIHPFRIQIDDDNDPGQVTNRSMEGYIIANIGGQNVNHTRRRLTFTALIQNTNPSATYTVFIRNEDRGCLNYHMHHAELVDAPGPREMSLRLFLESSDSSRWVVTLRRGIYGTTVDHSHRLHTRASFGIRFCQVTGIHLPS